jgi:hypothetical protein
MSNQVGGYPVMLHCCFMDRAHIIPYSRVLWLLLFLFCLRVLSQLVVYFFDVPFLPAFEHWHSASIPYGVLVFSQLIIILIFSRIALQFTRGRVVARHRVGMSLLILGGIYFFTMLARLIIGLAALSEQPWWNKPIPSFFHLDLAIFLIVLGWFHWRYGTTQD